MKSYISDLPGLVVLAVVAGVVEAEVPVVVVVVAVEPVPQLGDLSVVELV